MITVRARTLATLAGLTLSFSAVVQGAPVSHAAGAAVNGCVSLREMGVSGFDVTREITKPSSIGGADFDLPGDASQGPSTWYVMHLHVAVTDSPGTSGTADVSASTDGATAAHVILNPGAAGGVDWSTGGIAEADQRGHSPDGTVEVHMENYLQYSGIKGGHNTIEFNAEAFGTSKIQHVHVFDDTCIEKTGKSPDVIGLSTRVVQQSVVSGSTFTVQFKLHNQGSGAVLGARLSAVSADGGLAPAGDPDLVLPTLTADWSGQLDFKALSPGTHLLRILVGTSARPSLGGAEISVKVGKQHHSAVTWTALSAATLIVVAGFLLFRSGAHSRKDGSKAVPAGGAQGA